jgi:hypothetical protein
MSKRLPPRQCPVCNEELHVTRLNCHGCGSELSGTFDSCEFCALTESERGVLRVFLASRGNIKDLERYLGVSYPTARQRLADVCARLRIDQEAGDSPLDVLQTLAKGQIDIDEARQQLIKRGYGEDRPNPAAEDADASGRGPA